MKDRYAYLTEFENLLGSFQTNPDSDIEGCLRRHFTTPDNLARFMGFCQAIFRLDADKYHRDFAVEVMAATGLALSDLARNQAAAWYRGGEPWPRLHTSGYCRVIPGTDSPLPGAGGSTTADEVTAGPPRDFTPQPGDTPF